MKTKPDVILFNCDDMGYGDLGCYGSRWNDTPAIDRLAAGGVRFTNFYACSPVCSPSRAGLLTGCYPTRVDIPKVLFPGEADCLALREYTLGNLFRDAGYRTCMVGKWHLGDQPGHLPTDFGFDSYLGLPYSNDMGIQAGKDPEKTVPLPLLKNDSVWQLQPDQRGLTERYVDRAMEFLREEDDRPRFLYFAHMHVHLPLYASDTFVKRSRNGDYGACIASVDWSVDVIVKELEAQGRLENTLLLFTSDNGSLGFFGGSNKPLRGNKTTNWEGGQRVPMIAYWKDHLPAGRIASGIASNIDILPTLAGLIGQPLSDAVIDGQDLRPLFTGASEAGREEFVYWHGRNPAAIRLGRYKLHCLRQGQPVRELYDLEADVGEQEDLAEKLPEVTAALEARLEEWRRKLGDASRGIIGSEVRPCYRAEDPQPLAHYDPNHPYIIASYDKNEVG
ncbi:MAG: sulfatase [Christensenellales bacterium]|jgi:arylsulfatase A